jgi:hypothetical protein
MCGETADGTGGNTVTENEIPETVFAVNPTSCEDVQNSVSVNRKLI